MTYCQRSLAKLHCFELAAHYVRGHVTSLKSPRLLAVPVALAVSGCAVVGSSSVFDQAIDQTFDQAIDAAVVPVGCRSSLGSYSLPKTVIRIRITKNPAEPFHVLQELKPNRVPDNQHTFCLDHLRLPTASDEVRVFKNKIVAVVGDAVAGDDKIPRPGKRKVTKIEQEATPFLQLVASKAVDHTAGIIRRLIRAAFILITNKGSFSPARSAIGNDGKDVVVADFEVDPFDYQEMAQVNEAVRGFGFCFALEDYTFNAARDAGVSADQYCRKPYATARAKPPPAADAIQKLHYLAPKPTDGIFFRPRASYRFSVFIKDDPDGRGTWRLGQIRNIDMENIMPIVSVGVGRAAFATQRTGLVFDDGTLTNVCISKGSEIEGVIQIPLEVIYGLIALPSEMILGAIDDAKTAKQLLEARNRLITAQNQYIKYLNREVGLDGLAAATDEEKKKGGALKLGAVTNTQTFGDDPPDAGPILASEADALNEICAELSQVKPVNVVAADKTVSKGGF